eukprot:CAMPEP_0172662796 /NCGR_PEP_ID=MMETSP1074-20121228/5554_1 /TAXON_ID=2916 /ORGANISM="Ceratium fusus, Strain PA161109" /LENGTH=87 /DNA_ID=CAMNT_0013478731 /DNA_START=638 /DNA_END=899 /DNA_ORIENTATION=+
MASSDSATFAPQACRLKGATIPVLSIVLAPLGAAAAAVIVAAMVAAACVAAVAPTAPGVAALLYGQSSPWHRCQQQRPGQHYLRESW